MTNDFESSRGGFRGPRGTPVPTGVRTQLCVPGSLAMVGLGFHGKFWQRETKMKRSDPWQEAEY